MWMKALDSCRSRSSVTPVRGKSASAAGIHIGAPFKRLTQPLFELLHFGPRGVERGIGKSKRTSAYRLVMHVGAVADPCANAHAGLLRHVQAKINAQQIEAIARHLREIAEVGQRIGQTPQHQFSARSRWHKMPARFTHIGHQRQAAGRVQAQPGAAAREILSAEDRLRGGPRPPPLQRQAGPRKELIAVGGQHKREPLALTDQQGCQAHRGDDCRSASGADVV
jgi:hypothetical protein